LLGRRSAAGAFSRSELRPKLLPGPRRPAAFFNKPSNQNNTDNIRKWEGGAARDSKRKVRRWESKKVGKWEGKKVRRHKNGRDSIKNAKIFLKKSEFSKRNKRKVREIADFGQDTFPVG